MKKIIVLAVFAVMCITQRSEGALMLAATINGVNYCATDNNSLCGFGIQILDLDASVGRLELGNQNIGGIDFVGSAQQATLGPTQNILNTSFLQATNNTGSTILGSVAISATGFMPPVNRVFTSGAATFQNAVGSTIRSAWYNDPANNQGAETATDRPGILVDSFSYNVTQIADAFSHTSSTGVSDLSLFSMTLATDFSLVSGSQITNRGMTEIKPVPEPATLLLFGIGLVAAAKRIRR